MNTKSFLLFHLLVFPLFVQVLTQQADQAPCAPGSYSTPLNSDCVPCPAGTFQSSRGALTPSACKPCSAGTFSSSGSASCEPCSSGTNSSIGSSECASCPAGSVPTSTGDCTPCTDGYAAANSAECTPCRDGFSAPPGSTARSACRRTALVCGLHRFDAGGVCRDCPIGTFSDVNNASRSCTPCPSGTAGHMAPGMDFVTLVPVCTPCESGFEAVSTGNTICRRIGGTCPDGFEETTTGDCIRCPVDTSLLPRQQQCAVCSAGFGARPGPTSVCQPCREIIQQEVYTSACFQEFPNAVPAVSGQCPPGSFVERPGNVCSMCPKGTFSDSANARECTPCAEGSVQPEMGGTECVMCAGGTVPNDSNSMCVEPTTGCANNQELRQATASDTPVCVSEDCPSGEVCTFCVNEGDEGCRNCAPKQVPVQSGLSCERCPMAEMRDGVICGCRGKFSERIGIQNGTCSRCPSGSYGTDRGSDGQNTCVQCPAGTFRNPERRTTCRGAPVCTAEFACQKCPPGMISEEGATECTMCPSGTFTYGIGDTECIPF